MVASALPGEGKSSVVRNLAIAYRDAGLRVAVLETDLRRPSLATLFDVEAEPGLAEALNEHASGAELLQQVAVADAKGGGSNGRPGRIDVLTSGRVPDDPTALLTPERLRPVLATLAADHDIVLVDSAPTLTVSDSLPLLPLVDGVVLVVRARLSTPASAARLRRTLKRIADVQIVGTVVNDVTEDPTHYYRPGRGTGQQAGDERQTLQAPADGA
jgi:capsular exopolysaccharide synthesis family protein